MVSIEYKSIDRLQKGDRLLVDAGIFSKAGKEIDEKTIKLLARHNVNHIPIISLSYEEKEKLSLLQDDSIAEKFILQEIEKRKFWFDRLRLRLIDKLKTIYIPFHESDRIFQLKGKKKQLIPGKLLEEKLPSLYQPDTDAGSESLLNPNQISFLIEIIKALFKHLDFLSYLGPDTRNLKKRINRITLNSILLHSLFNGDRLSNVGDAVPWHVLDTALYYLYAVTNLNKKRSVRGCPLSVARFDPDQHVDESAEFQYYPGTICDAVLGVLLHKIGFYHESIHPILSAKSVLDPEDPACQKKIRLLRRSDNVTRNLLKNRKDISSISKMICFMQHEYADGTGFPPLNENRYVHELVRMLHIVNFYVEMTNPIISKTPFSRFEVIEYMQKHSGEYKHTPEKFIPQPRFDSKLLKEFLQILTPYDTREKVYLYPSKKRNRYYFVGRVSSYMDSHIPLISILSDEKNNKKYRFGELFFYIPTGTAFSMEKGRIAKKTQQDWIKELEIFDLTVNPGDIAEYRDPLYGTERVLSRRFKK